MELNLYNCNFHYKSLSIDWMLFLCIRLSKIWHFVDKYQFMVKIAKFQLFKDKLP